MAENHNEWSDDHGVYPCITGSIVYHDMVMNRYTSMSTQEISYSEFLEKVEDGEKVESVEI